MNYLAEFDDPRRTVAAVRQLRERGYHDLDAYTPFPVHGLQEALDFARSPLNWYILPCAVLGGLTGYLVQWWCNAYDYPLDVGGRPLHSAPAFIPITFELTVLGASLGGVIIFLLLCKLPELYNPVSDVPGFERATIDRFFVAIGGRRTLDEVTRDCVAAGALRVVAVPGRSR